MNLELSNRPYSKMAANRYKLGRVAPKRGHKGQVCLSCEQNAAKLLCSELHEKGLSGGRLKDILPQISEK